MIRKLLVLFVTSGLAAKAWKTYTESRRTQREQRLHRQEVQRWEDEGGLPAQPAMPPRTSQPT